MFNTLKAVFLPLVKVTETKETFDSDGNTVQTGGGAMHTFAWMVQLAGIALAIYLSWQCTTGGDTAIRVLWALLAGFCGYLYVLYYVIYHILMKQPCSNTQISDLFNSGKGVPSSIPSTVTNSSGFSAGIAPAPAPAPAPVVAAPAPAPALDAGAEGIRFRRR
jgi:hypothetical protein